MSNLTFFREIVSALVCILWQIEQAGSLVLYPLCQEVSSFSAGVSSINKHQPQTSFSLRKPSGI